MSENAKPSQRILRRDKVVPIVRKTSLGLAEHLQLQFKPQHADSWELDNPIFPKVKIAEVIGSLPKYNKEHLRLDKDGVYYTLSFGDLMDLLAVTPAATGPAVLPVLVAVVSVICDEINNDLVLDLKLWVEISSGSKPICWRDQTQELEASSRQVEMADHTRQLVLNNHHFNILQLLQVIVCTHCSITRQEFVAHFAGESPETQDFNSEYFLQLAMLQGIRADIEVTRDWEWHFYRLMDLVKPIPAFGSAYNFYDTLKDVANPQRSLGFYMIPANPEANIQLVWVPLQVDDFEATVSSGTKISCST
ncbi:hypothetical protein K438DRAFT_2017208 [Mycena galopus ATCC 62051]|nr:hypothetical protein K438DRAFT_2017208 [Mycena galopus ATCC 62051]